MVPVVRLSASCACTFGLLRYLGTGHPLILTFIPRTVNHSAMFAGNDATLVGP